MDNLLNELDVEKLARALPDGFARDQAVAKAAELFFWAKCAVAEAEPNEDTSVEVMRSSGGGRGSGRR